MRKLVLLLIALFSTATMFADDKATFTATAPDVVVVGDQFRLSYKVTTQKVKDFRAPSIKGFEVLMGPTRSTFQNTQIMNGAMTSEKGVTFTYILMANTAGSYTVPGATIVADGNSMVSNSVHIKVLPADQTSSQGSSQQSGKSGSSSSSATVSSQDLFVTANVSKTSVYEQEALLLTYKIYTRDYRMGLDNVKLPDFKGFHSQEIERPNDAKWTQEHYNGRNYYTTVYRQFVLFPQQSGKLSIEPARFDATVEKVIQSDDPFEAFFNGGGNVVQVKKTLTTPTININVSALPSGKPEGFSGGVGEFNISSSINSQNVKTNDAVTVKIVISGTGNLKLLADPEVKFPEGFELYDPKVDNQVKLTANGLSGNKVIEYLAIPREAGDYKIPAVKFSYFDIKSKSYKTLTTEEYNLHVEKGAGNASNIVSNFTNKEDLKILGEDIRYIKLNDVTMTKKGDYFFGSFAYWLFYIIPGVALVILLIMYRKHLAESSNVSLVRTKKANKIATKRMKVAGKLLAENNKEAFYDEVLKALWGYISDKLNIPVSQLTKDNIAEKLAGSSVNQELTDEFISVLNECEFARFAPGDANKTMDKVYSAAIEVISRMENTIKR